MLFASPFITVYILVLQGMIGAVLASFLGCFAYRICVGESVLRGRSHCDECGHTLSALDLIPILSFIINKGRCRYCGKKISASCLYGEITLSALFVVCTLVFDLTWQLGLVLFFVCILYTITLTDINDRIIPDRFIIAAIVVRIVYYIFVEGFSLTGFLWLLFDGFIVSVPILILTIIMEAVLNKEALGGGDIKLLFVMGLYLGWANCLLMLLIACVTGIVAALMTKKPEESTATEENEENEEETGKQSIAIPFGPFLAVGAVCALLFGDKLIAWYLSLFI